MATYLIWLDDNGHEIKRKQKGRGRAPGGFSKGEDGNWYAIASALEAVAKEKASQAKAPAEKKTHYFIWLDEDGNEIKRKPKMSRGRAPGNFSRRADGNWYCKSWRKTTELVDKTEASSKNEEVREDLIPRARYVKANKQTTPEAIERVCHVVDREEQDGTLILSSPVLVGDTGLDELDEIDGQPLFHRIEINPQANTVSVWNVTSPGGPYLIVEDALTTNMGDHDAIAARQDG